MTSMKEYADGILDSIQKVNATKGQKANFEAFINSRTCPFCGLQKYIVFEEETSIGTNYYHLCLNCTRQWGVECDKNGEVLEVSEIDLRLILSDESE